MSHIVQSLWIGSSLPSMQRLSIQSFLSNGHEYHLYAYEDIGNVPEGTTICDASTILPAQRVFRHKNGFGAGSYSTFSNLFRYKLILERGGWWVDTDLVCLRQFDFKDEFVFAAEYEEDYTILTSTCAFKSPPGAECLDYCFRVSNSKNKDDLKWSEIGPYLFDEAIKRFQLTRYLTPVHVFNPINTWEFIDILKTNFGASRLTKSYGVHLWNQLWTNEGLDPDNVAQPNSLYAFLRDQYLIPADGS